MRLNFLFPFFSVLVFSGFTSAYPNINDSAIYEGLLTSKDGNNFGFIQELTIISFDAVKLEFEVKEELFLPNGSMQTSSSQAPLADFKTKNEMTLILKNCEKMGGAKEKVHVNAGDFEACKVIRPANEDGESSTTWLGDVPFNIVKQERINKEGVIFRTELTLFKDSTPN